MKQESIGILIVDDEFSVRDSLYNWFRKDGYKVGAAENATEALKQIQKTAWHIVLLDIKMPGMDGIELQRRIRQIDPNMIVIIITAYASVDTAVVALKQGAFDYVTKPIDPDDLAHLVRNAVEQLRLKNENAQLREKIDRLSELDEVIGDSPPMKEVLNLVSAVAQSDATVLVRGESGTGKELVARTVHASSGRRYFPLVPVNCGAVPDSILESELFGHVRGAFTGAHYRRKGKLEMADGGTLFLDEIGTISPKMQVDLLRVLESKEFVPLGGSRSVYVDFRVICATNQNLEKAVEAGAFREDLYYRINVFAIPLPPLRERNQDIPALARYFLRRYALQMNKKVSEISPEAMTMLTQYGWPGNVRELANAIERAMVVGTPPVLRPRDLPVRLSANRTMPCDDSLAEVEKAHVKKILERTSWNITHAAEVLKVDRVTIYNKIKKYGIRK